MTGILASIMKRFGFRAIHPIADVYPAPDMEAEFIEMAERCLPYTLTSMERLYALYTAVNYVLDNEIRGDLVECGVWKGGSAMMMAEALVKRGVTDRNLVLYDTFDGMTESTARDLDFRGVAASHIQDTMRKKNGASKWAFAPLQEVRQNLQRTPFPIDRIELVQGKVEETIPQRVPEQISILRLDTDWYESTYHELVHLYPLVTDGGVIIIDDYGHWKGSRDATDQFLRENRLSPLMHRVDYTARVFTKPIAGQSS